MKYGEILDCEVVKYDERGYAWVRYSDLLGVIDPSEVAWDPADAPKVGERVKVTYKFATDGPADVPACGFQFTGSIIRAYPETHPIRRFGSLLVGERFISRVRLLGIWAVVSKGSRLWGTFPRNQLPSDDASAVVEVEIVGIDYQRERLNVRFLRIVEQ